MEIRISNHDDGTIAGVTPENQLKVEAENLPLQHYVSRVNQNAYQVWGTATPVNGTVTVLHIKNTDPNNYAVVTYIRVGAIGLAGGTAPPAAANYFEIAFDRTVSSGGTAVTAVNVNRSSGKTALITATHNGPTMTGTAVVSDRHYLQAQGDETVHTKAGSMILGLNDTLEVRFISDNTSGTLYSRITFLMMPFND